MGKGFFVSVVWCYSHNYRWDNMLSVLFLLELFVHVLDTRYLIYSMIYWAPGGGMKDGKRCEARCVSKFWKVWTFFIRIGKRTLREEINCRAW
jgi:hypothetical protein